MEREIALIDPQAGVGRRWRRLVVPAALVALAYLLYVTTLDWQSLWIDEIQAFDFINKSLRRALAYIISPEQNGPLYYFLLWCWYHVVGTTDFALRYFSALCSVLTVALIWQIARLWFDRRVAGWSGLLFAVSPFAIWYAQEAKMYALHMVLASMATLFLVQAHRRNRWPAWLGYAVSLELLAYSHFFGAFAIAAQGLVTVVISLLDMAGFKSGARRARARGAGGWPVLRSYLLTMALVALPYLPVLRFAMRILPDFTLQDISKGHVTPVHMVMELASEYTLRVSRLYVARLPLLLAALGGFLLLGLAAAWRRGWRRGVWLGGLLLLPILIFYPVSLLVPVFSPKYLSATFPFLVITLAMALDALRRLWRPLVWAGLAVMVGTAGWAHVRSLTDPAFQRSDWRATAWYLEAHAGPDDAIVVFAHYIALPMRRYYDGAAPVYSFEDDPWQPEWYYREWLQGGQDPRLMWLVLHHDQAMAPHHRLQAAAGELYPMVTGIYPNNGNIAVLGYSMRWRHDDLPARATPAAGTFANGLAIRGYTVDAEALPPVDRNFHPPSNWLHVTTYWQLAEGLSPQDAPAPDFQPYLHVVDDQGGVWAGELQRPPTVFHFDPPATWAPGAVVEAHYDVNFNPVTPPGNYRLVLGMVDGDGAPVALLGGGTEVVLRTIEVTR
jgi:4-amino-4-deoxy-L-arabinose transferase-like glycosyltransferase